MTCKKLTTCRTSMLASSCIKQNNGRYHRSYSSRSISFFDRNDTARLTYSTDTLTILAGNAIQAASNPFTSQFIPDDQTTKKGLITIWSSLDRQFRPAVYPVYAPRIAMIL